MPLTAFGGRLCCRGPLESEGVTPSLAGNDGDDDEDDEEEADVEPFKELELRSK